MNIFTFEHAGGADLHIKSIEVKLSQACEPIIGTIARMAYSNDGMFGTGFLGDIKEDVIEPKVRDIVPDPTTEEIKYKSGLPDCSFMKVLTDSRASPEEE